MTLFLGLSLFLVSGALALAIADSNEKRFEAGVIVTIEESHAFSRLVNDIRV